MQGRAKKIHRRILPPVGIEPGTLALWDLLCYTLMPCKLAQSGKHQSGSQEVPGSIPLEVTFLAKIISLFPTQAFIAKFANFV